MINNYIKINIGKKKNNLIFLLLIMEKILWKYIIFIFLIIFQTQKKK